MTPAVGPGLVLGLASALFWGTSNVLAAFLRGRLDGWRQLGVWQAMGLPVVILIGLTTPGILPDDPGIVAAGLGAGLLATIAYASMFACLRLGPIAVVSPVIAANGGLGAVLAVVVLRETLSPLQALGAALATAGVVMVGVRFEGDLRRTRLVGPGVLFALIAMTAFALQTIVLSPVSHGMGWQTSFVLSRIATVTSVGAILLVGDRRRRDPDAPARPRIRDLPRRLQAALLLGGVASVTAFLTFAAGLERSYAWVIGVTSTCAPIVVLTAGVVLFGERLRPIQWAGVAIVLASVVLVSLG